MKYILILGRNPELSFEEVLCYLSRKEKRVKNFNLTENAMYVHLEDNDKFDNDEIENLGGVIAISEVISSSENIDDLVTNLYSKSLYLGCDNKLNYLLYSFPKDMLERKNISDYLKLRFKQEKVKATEKPLKPFMELQSGEFAETSLSSSQKIGEKYVLSKDFEGNFHFARIFSECDYKSIEKRDMEKSVRRSGLSISPRISKIMVNLSKVPLENSGNRIIVDCFCGIGALLQEALLQDIKVVGIDSDKEAIKGAKKNFDWFSFSKNKFDLINSDSSKVRLERSLKKFEKNSFFSLVTEPHLGELLKKPVFKEKALMIQSDFEKLMIGVLNNLKKYVSGRFVFTAPYLKTGKKNRVGCNIKNICENTGLKVADSESNYFNYPFNEFPENKIMGRQIFVLEK